MAGVLFAASVSVKVYSIFVLPYLIARKQWRMAGAMVDSLLISFVALPVLYFGWHDALSLSRLWIDGIADTSRPDFCLTYPAYKVSLAWIALLLMNPAASQGLDHAFNVCNWSTAAIGWVVKIVCLAWGLLVAGYFVGALRGGNDRKHEKLAMMLDISVLLFCAFPASSFLQPHHLAVMVVPAICLVHVVFDREFKPRSRIVAGLTVGLGFGLTGFGPGNPLRGVGVMAIAGRLPGWHLADAAGMSTGGGGRGRGREFIRVAYVRLSSLTSPACLARAPCRAPWNHG